MSISGELPGFSFMRWTCPSSRERTGLPAFQSFKTLSTSFRRADILAALPADQSRQNHDRAHAEAEPLRVCHEPGLEAAGRIRIVRRSLLHHVQDGLRPQRIV